MEWFLLEMLVALLLAVFIVWFTMGRKRKDEARGTDTRAGENEDQR